MCPYPAVVVGRCVFDQESAQHRIADYHARDAGAAWLILACQSVVAAPNDDLLEEVRCRPRRRTSGVRSRA